MKNFDNTKIIGIDHGYGGYLSAQEQEERFAQRVNDSLRQTLQEMFGMALARAMPAVKPTESTPELAEESGEIADDFLENFI